MVYGASTAFGAVDLPWRDDSPHTVFVGAPRTGKTILLRMLMQSMMFDEYGNLACRAVIHDPKREFYPLLVGMGVGPSMIRVMHPLDVRSSPWHLAHDFVGPERITALANALIPGESTGDNAVFGKGARQLVKAVVTILHERCGCEWRLNDVYNICSSGQLIAHVLNQSPALAQQFASYFTSARQRDAFIINVQAFMGVFATVAAANARALEGYNRTPSAGTPISLSHWFTGEKAGVLLLTSDPMSSAAMLPFNHAAFEVLADLALQPGEGAGDSQAQFYIDEARTQYPLPSLERLITQGASKSVRVATVVHTLEGLREVYRGSADEILGASTNVAMTATNSPVTKRWFLDIVAASQGREASEQRGMIDRRFQHLGVPDESKGIVRGLFKIPNRPAWFGQTDKKYQKKHLRKASGNQMHAGMIRDNDPGLTQAKPMQPVDWARLRLPVPPESANNLLGQGAGWDAHKPQQQQQQQFPPVINVQLPPNALPPAQPAPRELTEAEQFAERRKNRRGGFL